MRWQYSTSTSWPAFFIRHTYLKGCLIATILWWGSMVLLAHPAQAQVILTEVYPAPPAGEQEWVEVYNQGELAVDLTGWYLMDALATPSVIAQWTTLTLHPKQYAVIDIASAKLNNTGDSVVLFDATGQQHSSMSYTSSTPGGSWAWNPELHHWFATTPSPGQPAALPSPTPTPSPSPIPVPATPTATPSPVPNTPTPKPSAVPSPLPTPSSPPVSTLASQAIRITEIHACPEKGQPEWVELHNTSQQAGTLSNWKILDLANNAHSFSLSLQPGEYAVVTLPTQILNNTGDTVYLLDTTGAIVTQHTFGSCTTGLSWSLASSGQWHATPPSPNHANPAVENSSVGGITSIVSTPLIETTNGTASSLMTELPAILRGSTLGDSTGVPGSVTQVLPYQLPQLRYTTAATASAILLDPATILTQASSLHKPGEKQPTSQTTQPHDTITTVLPSDTSSFVAWNAYLLAGGVVAGGSLLVFFLVTIWNYLYASKEPAVLGPAPD